MTNEDELLKIVNSLAQILDAYQSQKPVMSCQGQVMDGYSALANFVNVTEKAKIYLQIDNQRVSSLTTAPDGHISQGEFMLAEQMRYQNHYHSQICPGDWRRPWAEQDIRFAEFLEWLRRQDQVAQDAVTLAMHLTTAYQTKFSPLEHSPVDEEVLARVEETQKRLGVDFLYT